MTSDQFAYWMQSLFEVADLKTLDEKQVETIKNHLKLVFLYDIDPSYTQDPNLKQVFQNIHDGKEPFDGLIVAATPVAAWTAIQKPIPPKVDPPSNNVQLKC